MVRIRVWFWINTFSRGLFRPRIILLLIWTHTHSYSLPTSFCRSPLSFGYLHTFNFINRTPAEKVEINRRSKRWNSQIYTLTIILNLWLITFTQNNKKYFYLKSFSNMIINLCFVFSFNFIETYFTKYILLKHTVEFNKFISKTGRDINYKVKEVILSFTYPDSSKRSLDSYNYYQTKFYTWITFSSFSESETPS